MWAHYPDNYQGICYCYCKKSILEAIARWNNGKKAKQYIDGDRLEATLAKVDYPDNFPPTFENDLKALSTKTNGWSYEDEWRLLVPLSSGNNVQRSGIEFSILGALRDVYFGPKSQHFNLIYDMARHFNKEVKHADLIIDPVDKKLSLRRTGKLSTIYPALKPGGAHS